MAGVYACLSADWLTRGWSDVEGVLANRRTGKYFTVPAAARYVAESCDGATDFHSMAFLPSHLALLDELIDRGIARKCALPQGVSSYQLYRRARNPFVRCVHWAVTGHCNLDCRYCYMESPSGKYGQLPLGTMLKIVRQMAEANVLQVSFTGGEPLLRKDLLQIVVELRDCGIHVREIFTNGTLVTDKFLSTLIEQQVVPAFQISFDGVGFHDRMRGRYGIEKQVVGAIRLLRSAGFEVIVATNVDRETAGCLDATYDLMRGVPVTAWRVGVPLEVGKCPLSNDPLSLEEQADMFAPIVKRWRADGRPFEIVTGLFFRGAAGEATTTVAIQEPYEPGDFDCDSVRLEPHLLPDGTLVPCPGYVGTSLEGDMPNILDSSFSEVWANSILRRIADTRKSDILMRNPGCADCDAFANCGGGCRASALRETGDLMAADPVACELWSRCYKHRFHRLGTD